MPPSNHRAKGRSHSSTVSQGRNQSRAPACSAQKPCQSASARLVDAGVGHHRLAPERVGRGEHPVLGEIVLDGGLDRGRWLLQTGAVPGRQASLPHSFTADGERLLRLDAPQPNAGGPLRWKGRDCERTAVGGERAPAVESRAPEADAFSPEPGVTRIDVPLGRRVMVVSDLLLTPEATPTSSAVTAEVARALDTWDGPGILIIAGNLFDLSGSASPLAESQRSLDAHPALAQALSRFLDHRRAAGHPPDRHPRARLRHRPRHHGRHRRPGRRAGRARRPPPAHGHRRPGGAGGAG